MKRILFVFVLILGLSSLHFSAPRTVVVSALGDGSKETSAIRVWHYSTNVEDSIVHVGDRFEAGDMLTANSDITIQLSCPEGTAITFSGRFRAMIGAPKQKNEDCAVDLLAGKVDILTNRPTSTKSGTVVAAARGTVYSVRIARDEKGPTVWCAVLDGEVDVTGDDLDTSRLKVGLRQSWAPAGEKIENVTADDIKGTAALYARMDVAKARMAGAQTAPSTVSDLETSYLRVFQTPSDSEARVDLAAKQTNLKVTSSAIYQLGRAEKLTPANDKAQLARIAAIQSVTYQESGDSKKAAEQAAKAQKIDPNVLKAGNLAKYKIDPARIPAARPSAYNPKNDAILAPNQTSSSVPQIGGSSTAVATAPNTASTNVATTRAATQISQGVAASAAAPSLAAPPDSKTLMNLISRKQYAEAASGFEKRLQLVGQNARDAYGAALAYSNMGKKPEAARYATMAIDANRKKQELTDAELKTCRDIQSAK